MEPVEVSGARIAVAVGDEDPAPEAPADLQVIVCASHVRPGAFDRSLARRAPPGRPQVRVNLVGGNDELILDGRSSVLDAKGRVVALLPPFAEEVRVVDLAACEPLSPEQLEEPPWEEQVLGALVLGTRDFAEKNRIDRLVLGLSGGVDSALVAAIAAEAVGPGRVTAVAMPSRFTDPRSTQWARQHAADLGLAFEVVELEPMHVAAEQTLGELLSRGTAAENVQARLRAVILMAMVNHHGGLLLCTSNKTELALGYGTMYGDLAGGLCPIGDLTKLEVLRLARWLHQTRELIPQPILDRPPTAELRPDQVDPFDYETVAPALERLVLADRSNAAMRRSEHKRHQAGVVLKLSDRAFGPGRMMPITRR
jgi:NAD+ synthetase